MAKPRNPQVQPKPNPGQVTYYLTNRRISVMPKKGNDRGMTLPEGSYLLVEDPAGDLMRVQLPNSDKWLAVEVPGLSILLSCPWITCVVEVPKPPVRVPQEDIPKVKAVVTPPKDTPTPKKALVAPAIDTTFPEPWAYDPKEDTYWQKANGYLIVAFKDQKPTRANQFVASKLNQEQVDEIRSIGRSMTQEAIGKRYGITAAYVGQILNWKAWRS